MKNTVRLRIGDIFIIPLSDGRKAYGQYVYRDKMYGSIMQVYDYFTTGQEDPDIDAIVQSELLFPPIFAGFWYPIKEGIWRVIGNKTVSFKFPGFLNTLWDPKTGKAGKWFLWNGSEEVALGDRVPEEYRNLEFMSSPAYDLVVKRIETGIKPMQHLIDTNYFRSDQLD